VAEHTHWPGLAGDEVPVAGPDVGTLRETTHKLPGSREQVPATEAVRAELGSVTATTVLLDRSGAESITAERVQLERSGAKDIDSKSAQLDRSGVVALGSEHAVLLHSSAVQVVAEEARITDSTVAFLLTKRVRCAASKWSRCRCDTYR